jgi:hypothetical protein
VSSEIVRPAAEQERLRRVTSARELVVEAIGPLTMLGGFVWALAQPYRVVFFYPDGKGFYDYVAQPPLLVVLVGLAFWVLVARRLVKDIRAHDGDGTAG